MPQQQQAYNLLFLLCLALICGLSFAQVTYSTCTVTGSGGCLDGMVVTSNYTRNVAPCRDQIVYTFKTSKCALSNFVTNGAQPASFGSPNCASDKGAPGYNKVFCPWFGSLFSNPYKIDTDGGCATETIVNMIVPSGQYVPGVIGLKGGTDCTNCSLYTYTPFASLSTSLGACATNTDCNDNNACTVDTCDNSGGCGICSNVQTNSLCAPCQNDTDCSGQPEINKCTYWTCSASNGTCVSNTYPNCYACQTDADCPVVGTPGTTCLENQCVQGLCVQSTKAGCCDTAPTTSTVVEACYTCTLKTGCGFSNDNYQCVATNSSVAGNSTFNATSASLNSTLSTANCSTYGHLLGDGGGVSGDGGVGGGTLAAIIVPVVAAAGAVGLALATFAAAIAFLIARNFQKGQIAAQLQSIGFTENESNMIVNSALYKTEGGENPFFISTDDSTGARVLHLA